MVERIDFPDQLLTWTRFEDTIAVLGLDAGGNVVASLVSLVHDEAGVLFTVPAPDGFSVHPGLDGGLHVFDEDGTLRTHDASGEPIGELATEAQNPLVNTMDPSSGVLAVAADPGGVVVIDPARGEVEPLPENELVANLGALRPRRRRCPVRLQMSIPYRSGPCGFFAAVHLASNKNTSPVCPDVAHSNPSGRTPALGPERRAVFSSVGSSS